MATDDPSIDIIEHLCLEAGRMMEDASLELALGAPSARDEQTARLERLNQVAGDIAALAAAAEVLHRRGGK